MLLHITGILHTQANWERRASSADRGRSRQRQAKIEAGEVVGAGGMGTFEHHLRIVVEIGDRDELGLV